MSSHAHDAQAALRFSRSSLWFALLFIALLGAAAILLAFGPASPAKSWGQALMTMLPMVIVLGLAGLHAQRGASASSRKEVRKLASDDLRQFSLGMAYRNGFFTVLAIQPLLAWLVISVPELPVLAVMAGSTAAAGTLVALGSILYCDR